MHLDRPLTDGRGDARPRARRAPRRPRAAPVRDRRVGLPAPRPSPVDRRALIPRPETEILVDRVLALLAGVEAPRVLDVGTGSGAIALAVARRGAGRAGHGIDVVARRARPRAARTPSRPGLAVDARRGAISPFGTSGRPVGRRRLEPAVRRRGGRADLAPEVRRLGAGRGALRQRPPRGDRRARRSPSARSGGPRPARGRRRPGGRGRRCAPTASATSTSSVTPDLCRARPGRRGEGRRG